MESQRFWLIFLLKLTRRFVKGNRYAYRIVREDVLQSVMKTLDVLS